jgi:hypothetical protein
LHNILERDMANHQQNNTSDASGGNEGPTWVTRHRRWLRRAPLLAAATMVSTFSLIDVGPAAVQAHNGTVHEAPVDLGSASSFGAAAAVCLAASAVVAGSVAVPAQTLALPGASESTVVAIEPTRIADTRYDIGLTGEITAETPTKFTVTGLIDTYIESTSKTVVKQVVPAGASGVFLNVTVVTPSAPGFLAIRPGTATGVPATGGLNFDQGTVLANGILIALPTTGDNAGEVDIYYGTPTADAFTDLIIDVVGYTTTGGLIALTKRIETLETSGPTGAQGEPGTNGNAGAKGDRGEPGTNGPVEGSVCVAGGVNGIIISPSTLWTD